MADQEANETERLKATLRRREAELAAAKQPPAPEPEPAPANETSASEALRTAASEAGMSPQKFVELSGKTTLAEWEAQRAAEAGGGSGTEV